jgi:hypothetical protein
MVGRLKIAHYVYVDGMRGDWRGIRRERNPVDLPIYQAVFPAPTYQDITPLERFPLLSQLLLAKDRMQ